MTVISAMKFNSTSGAMVADEQSSNLGRWRKYDFAEKIQVLDTQNKVIGIIGGAGAADILYDVTQRVLSELPQYKEEMKSTLHLAEIVNGGMLQVKRKYVDGHLLSLFGLSERDFQTGYVPVRKKDELAGRITEQVMDRYIRAISGNDDSFSALVNNSFLLLACDEERIQLYEINMGLANRIPVAQPYRTIGSGADMADEELSAFFDRIPRDQRENINPVEGISALIYATDRASVRNVGVGGIPFIYILKKSVSGSPASSKLIVPTENNSKLAVEVVRAARRDYISKGFEMEALEALMYKGEDFKPIEKEMWAKATNPQELSLLLRGYKV